MSFRNFIVWSFIFLNSPTLVAAVDPKIKWLRFDTEHFEVIYDANHQQLAEIYAIEAENAYKLLTPLFNNDAPKKTVLVIDDSTDSANGFATPIPRSLMNIYPVLPESRDALSHYTHWARELIIHEYTHILNFEPAGGAYKPFRFLLGSIVRPNGLLPRWYLEGLAVHMETEFTEHGRLRSPFYKAMVRAAVIADVWGLENLARANETSIPTWPFGSRPYFYGAFVWNELISQKGMDVVGRLNDRYSRRFPYFINAPLKDELGQDWNQLLTSTYNKHESIARSQIDRLQQAPTSDTSPAYNDMPGHAQILPAVSPDLEKLLFVTNSAEEDQSIYIAKRLASQSFSTLNAVKVQKGLEGISRVSWKPDSTGFIYNSQSTFERYNSFSDLHFYDLETKKSKRLTKGFRVRDAVFSPDGSRIFFVQNTAGGTRLVSVDTEGQHLKVHDEPELLVRLSYPEFISHNEVVYSLRDLKGKEHLKLLNITDNTSRYVLEDYEPVQFPQKTEEGLLFISSRTGVANLYVSDLAFKTVRSLTNTLTHISTGTYDSVTKEVWVSRLISTGIRLERFSITPISQALTTIDTGEGYLWKSYGPELPPADTSQQEPTAPTTPTLVKTDPKSYSGLAYLWPQYWLPTVFSGPYGTATTASIASQDPLLKHQYYLDGIYDSRTNIPGYGFGYINNQTPVTLALALSDQTTYLESLRTTNREIFISGVASYYIKGLSNDWRASTGWSYFANQYKGLPFTTQQGPTVAVKYSNLSQKGFEISPRSGLSAQTIYTHFLPKQGNIDYGRVTGDFSAYWSKWLPQYHAIQFRTAGTYTPRNRSLFRGTATGGGEYLVEQGGIPFIVRGYPPEEFIGWSFLTAGVEYRFPISYVYSGSGTTPFFFRRVHGAVFWDTLTTNGAFFNSSTKALERTHFGKYYSGYGVESRFDTTVFYNVPMTIKVGYHYGANPKAYGAGGIYVGFAVSAL